MAHITGPRHKINLSQIITNYHKSSQIITKNFPAKTMLHCDDIWLKSQFISLAGGVSTNCPH